MKDARDVSRRIANVAPGSKVSLTVLREGRTDLYWVDVALFCRPQNYRLGVRDIGPGDIVEIDTLAELAARDANYKAIWEKAHGKAN